MAGRGFPPKPKEQRRNHVPPSRGEWQDVPPLGRPVLPSLPRRGKGQGSWSERTRRLWEGYRADPVTGTYGATEIAMAVELAYLQEELVRGRLSLAGEIRQREDRLGLSPKGKRDLRFRVVSERPEVSVPTPIRPRRRRLRAVAP